MNEAFYIVGNRRSSILKIDHTDVLHMYPLHACLHSEFDKPLWSPKKSGKPAADLPLTCRTGPVWTIKHYGL